MPTEKSWLKRRYDAAVSVPAVFIDGALFVVVAWFIFNQSYFGGDEAAKYISPKTKFWFNWVIGSIATMAGSLKMFRSTAYAKHQEDKKVISNSTETVVKSETHSDSTKNENP